MKKVIKTNSTDLNDKRFSNDSLLEILVTSFIIIIVTFLFVKILFF